MICSGLDEDEEEARSDHAERQVQERAAQYTPYAAQIARCSQESIYESDDSGDDLKKRAKIVQLLYYVTTIPDESDDSKRFLRDGVEWRKPLEALVAWIDVLEATAWPQLIIVAIGFFASFEEKAEPYIGRLEKFLRCPPEVRHTSIPIYEIYRSSF